MVVESSNVENSIIALEGEVKGMSPQQKERYNAIYHIYGEESEEIVRKIKGKTHLSWLFVFPNILTIFRAKNEEAEYLKAIKQTFEVDNNYSEVEINQLVSEVRADLMLPPYMKRITALCLADFQLVFLSENVKSAGEKRSKIHKAVYCLVK